MPALVVTEKDGKKIVRCTMEAECRKSNLLYRSKLVDGTTANCYHGTEMPDDFLEYGMALERCANRKSFVYAGQEYETVIRKTNGEKGGQMLKGNPKPVWIFK